MNALFIGRFQPFHNGHLRILQTIYKKYDRIIFYPFLIRNNSYQQKYPTISQLILEGFNGVIPSGIRKSIYGGYGLTQDLIYVVYFLERNLPDIHTLIISTTKKTDIKNDIAIINAEELETIRRQISTESRKFKDIRKVVINNFFVKHLPQRFTTIKLDYIKGTISNILRNHKNISKSLSTQDRQALYDLYKKLNVSISEFELYVVFYGYMVIKTGN